MKDLTIRQREVLDLIKNNVRNYGFPPTRAEISKKLGFKSPNAAESHLRALEKKGVISIQAGSSRGIILNLNNGDLGIPIIGLVAAGGPILAQENIEKRISASQETYPKGIDFYLRVKGDSMIEAGILEDDLIGVNKDTEIRVGSIVIARIHDEVTVKTLKKLSTDKVILKPENSKYSNIEINPTREDLSFEGTCVGLLRNYS
ncbi:MAG: transcriptional repressor LexA [SAR86 cluster bacterium]|jgi:repressor LexA|nr:transcriptional repressor LexA [SAR86 cluster bacterium]